MITKTKKRKQNITIKVHRNTSTKIVYQLSLSSTMAHLSSASPHQYDPWVYEDRLHMMEHLLFSTHLALWTSGETEEERGRESGSGSLSKSRRERVFTPGCVTNSTLYDGHPLWGFIVQFQWQRSSGRLGMRDGETSGKTLISPDSWWGCMNYTLSALPFRIAKNLGFPLGDISDVTESQFDDALKGSLRGDDAGVTSAWTEYFLAIRREQRREREEGEGSRGEREREEQQRRQQELLSLQWSAHTRSIHYGLRVFSTQLSLLPVTEQQLGLGWVSMVEVMAGSHVAVTTRSVTELLNGRFLPPRMLGLMDASRVSAYGLTEEQREMAERLVRKGRRVCAKL
jgi:hypothetical protein